MPKTLFLTPKKHFSCPNIPKKCVNFPPSPNFLAEALHVFAQLLLPCININIKVSIKIDISSFPMMQGASPHHPQSAWEQLGCRQPFLTRAFPLKN